MMRVRSLFPDRFNAKSKIDGEIISHILIYHGARSGSRHDYPFLVRLANGNKAYINSIYFS